MVPTHLDGVIQHDVFGREQLPVMNVFWKRQHDFLWFDVVVQARVDRQVGKAQNL